jgi:putative DNA primase/helicase
MTLSESAIREHYRRAKPVYEALATVSDYPTIGPNDFFGWYIKRVHDDVEAIKAGYPQRGRVARLDHDYDEIHDRLERTLYAVTTYKTLTAFQQWEPCRYDESEGRTVWQDEPPTPGYVDLRAVPAWGDIDLADDIKPQRGDLDAQTRELVERTLDAYIDEYATLYGSRDAVYALDSVGGAYVFGAPEATLPIADHFSDDPDALERVFDEFLDRSNSWLQDAEVRVNERVDGAGDVIQPDWVNNKNRQYKPPLSLHADHDAVVTPIATDDVRYELRPFEAVDDALIEQAVSWANDLTRVEHTDCVDSLVATLWSDLYEDHDGWRATLEAWVDAERERERERQRQREAALQRRQERLAELDGSLEGRPITPFKEDVYEAVENIDIAEIACHYASDAYDTDPNQPRPQFDPCWRHSESGQSCFVDEQANTFGDSKVNAGGGPAKLMALATGIISDADADLDGEDYRAAVDELRSAGYDIPVWIPEAGSDRVDGGTYEQMPFWAVRKAAVALEVCPEDAFVDREGEDGTYEGFPGFETYNETLEAIETAGLKHGRERVTPDENTADDESESPAAASASDESAGDLDRAHLREKNRLLTAKVERLESELEEKSERIEDLEAEVDRLRMELATVRSERDRLEATIEEREVEQESNQRGRDEDQSPLDRAKQFVSFGE